MSRESQTPIVIERTYKATVRELWDLWATKEGFESWWGPEGFRVEVHKLEPRIGGTLHYDMIADSPEMIAAMLDAGRPASHPTRSRFSQWAPHTRLAITSVIDFLPGIETYESAIEVDFIDQGAMARMVVTLEPLHDPQFSQMQGMGMTCQFTKLDKRYA
jgi:uncharacterized protein YndB with AHSA1/START domain